MKSLSPWRLLFGTLIITSACGRVGGGGHGSGASGGDPTRTRLLEARLEAAKALRDFEPETLAPDVRTDAAAFLLGMSSELATDIDQSPHNWVKSQGTCAKTTQTRNATIDFDIIYCSAQVLTPIDAFKLVIHESVHHFGVADEVLPDLIAIAAYDAEQKRHSQNDAAAEEPRSEDSTETDTKSPSTLPP